MRFALPSQNRYPIDTLDQMKKAASYFEEYEREIPLRFRREYCKNLGVALQEVGAPLPEKIASYAGGAADEKKVKLACAIRGELLHKTADVISELDRIQKNFEDVDSLIDKLIKFDIRHRLDFYWDSDRLDNPITAVLLNTKDNNCPGILESGGEKASATQVDKLRHKRELLETYFNRDFVDDICKDPLSAYQMANDHEKKVLLDIASWEIA